MIDPAPRFVFGPYMTKRFGNPATAIPRYAFAPPRQTSLSSRPSLPRTSIGARKL